MRNNKGFTFIELLITMSLFAVAFLPLINMYTVALEQSVVTGDITTARYLAQEGMEKMKNLNFTEEQLKVLGDVWEPPLDKPSLKIDGQEWRVLRKLKAGSDPLEIRIQVFKDQNKKPVVELVTLFEDFDWAFTQ